MGKSCSQHVLFTLGGQYYTVSAPIERHSWLEHHGAHFGHIMVSIRHYLSKKYSNFGRKIAKSDHCDQPENLWF